MTKIVAVDLETSCGVKSCPGFGLSNSSQCEHAVHHKYNRIDIIGVYDGTSYYQFGTVEAFDQLVNENNWLLVGHGFKFDYKTLKEKGSKIKPSQVSGDTQLLASVVRLKVPADYLAIYSNKRKKLNESLPPKQRHRVGSPLSLKVLAPYYLNVDAFWENPMDHNDPDYNRLDCVYTLELHRHLSKIAKTDGTFEFYEKYLLPWNKLLTEAELEGILIDVNRLESMYAQALKNCSQLEEEVHDVIKHVFEEWKTDRAREISRESDAKCESYISKRIKNTDKIEGVKLRYAASCNTAISKLPKRFNLNSVEQMKYILSACKVDMQVEKRDKETNEWIEKEGTDKYVLKRAKIRQSSELAEKLLKFREKQTECRYLKQYLEAVVEQRIYCGFNATGTRTGRLSSSGPNLQNVKGNLREPFVVGDPELYSIYSVDASQIEPRIVAFLTNDREMVSLFQGGRDYHNYATKKFFPRDTVATNEDEIKEKFPHLRKTAKIGDLSIIYGTGASTFRAMCLLREEMDLSEEDARNMVYSFRSGMQGVFEWKKNLEMTYQEGARISNIFGRPVAARDGAIHMTLFNSYVQGMASDMILNASLQAYRAFCKQKIDAKPLIWVHDEVVWRLPKGQEQICKKIIDYYMTRYSLKTVHGKVPLNCDGKVFDRWEK